MYNVFITVIRHFNRLREKQNINSNEENITETFANIRIKVTSSDVQP